MKNFDDAQFDDLLKDDFDGQSPDAESRAILRQLYALEEVAPPPDLTERIMCRIAEEQKAPLPGPVPLFKRWAPVAAAVLLIAVAVPVLLKPQHSEIAQEDVNKHTKPVAVAQNPHSKPDQPVESGTSSQENMEPVTIASASATRSASYVPPEKVDAYFEQWDAELAETITTDLEAYPEQAAPIEGSEMTLLASLPEETLGYYESPYEDPLSALVGF